MSAASQVYDYIMSLYDSLEIPLNTIPIEYIKLYEDHVFISAKSFASHELGLNLNRWSELHRNEFVPLPGQVVGLNTIGMLADRLSILCIKKYLYLRQDRQVGGIDSQISELNHAISNVCPGHSSEFNKVTTLECDIHSGNFAIVLGDLCASNLLLWLAQDVLYLRGPEALPDFELREYIVLFSRLNVRRNRAISILEIVQWDRG
jgi:hypothetical protein